MKRFRKISFWGIWCLVVFVHRAAALVHEPQGSEGSAENCLLESLYTGQQIRAKFLPVGARSTVLRAWAAAPSGERLTETAPAPVAELAFTAPTDGDYCFCWSSEPQAVPVRLSLNVPQIPELETLLQKGHLDQVERSLFALAQVLQELKQRALLTVQEDFRTRQGLYGHSWLLQVMTFIEMLVLMVTVIWRVLRIQNMFRDRVPRSH
jgi:hypothetical protein